MSKNKQIYRNDVYKILKRFVKDCVNGDDFDLGISNEDPLSILKTWWNENKKMIKPSKVLTPKIRVCYFTEFGSETTVIELSELLYYTERFNVLLIEFEK